LGLFEVNEAAEIIAQAADPEANIIFGAVVDERMEDEVRVTVIATGFDQKVYIKPQTQKGADERSSESRPLTSHDDLDIPAFLRRR